MFSEDLDEKYGPAQSDESGVGTVSVTGRGYAVVRVYVDFETSMNSEVEGDNDLLCSSLISLPVALRLVELADWYEQYKTTTWSASGFTLGITHEARVGVVDHGNYQTIWTVDAIELGNVLRHFLTED